MVHLKKNSKHIYALMKNVFCNYYYIYIFLLLKIIERKSVQIE